MVHYNVQKLEIESRKFIYNLQTGTGMIKIQETHFGLYKPYFWCKYLSQNMQSMYFIFNTGFTMIKSAFALLSKVLMQK